jgi:hypothetical protein
MTVKETRKPPPNLTGKIRLTVGVHGEEGGAAHGEGLTVADVGSFHEFGLGVPQRSFIRGWFDEAVGSGELGALLSAQLKLAVAGKVTLDQALERVGLKVEAGVKKRITQRIPPPLAPSTIAKKGSSVPLIDTGQLRASIRAKVDRV